MGSISSNSSRKILAASSSTVGTTAGKFNKEGNAQVKSSFRKVDSHHLNGSYSKKSSLVEYNLVNPQLHEHLKKDGPAKEKINIKFQNAEKPGNLDWRKQVIDTHLLPRYYIGFSKFGQTAVAVLTTLPGYAMAPGALEPVTFACLVLGTALSSTACMAVNQVLEVPYDSQVNRTKNRVLVSEYLTPLHASTFAVCCGSIGLTTLYLGTNALTTALGATTLILYTCVYTPMKRYNIANTWMGSFVDAIPPVMGWTASTGSLSAGAILIGAIAYSWQFPRFNALSWGRRLDYSRAGYRMTCLIDPSMCRRVALRHSVGLLVICSCAPLLDLTTWTFAVDSLPLNCYLIYCAWKFYEDGDIQSARRLFRLTMIYLPALMFLMLVGKKYSSKDDEHEKGSLMNFNLLANVNKEL